MTANRFKDLVARGLNDFNSHTFNIILMDRDFTFNRVSHEVYADVSGFELPTLGGYTAGGQVLTGVMLTQNDTLNALIVSWDNASWIASADLEAGGAIIYNDSIASPIIDPILGFIDFGGALLTLNGGTKTIANLAFVIRARDSHPLAV